MIRSFSLWVLSALMLSALGALTHTHSSAKAVAKADTHTHTHTHKC